MSVRSRRVIQLTPNEHSKIKEAARRQHERVMRDHERARSAEISAQASRGEDLGDLKARHSFSTARQNTSVSMHLSWALGRAGMTGGRPVRSAKPPQPWKKSPDRFKKLNVPVVNWQIGKAPTARATHRRDKLFKRRQESLMMRAELARKRYDNVGARRLDAILKIEQASYSAQVNRDAAVNITAARGEKDPLVREFLREAAVSQREADVRLEKLKQYDREVGRRHAGTQSRDQDQKAARADIGSAMREPRAKDTAPLRAGRVLNLDGSEPTGEHGDMPRIDWQSMNGMSSEEIHRDQEAFEARMGQLASYKVLAEERGDRHSAQRWHMQMALESAARQLEHASAGANNELMRNGRTASWADQHGRQHGAAKRFNEIAGAWNEAAKRAPDTFGARIQPCDKPDDLVSNIDAVNAGSARARQGANLSVYDARALYRRESDAARRENPERADQLAAQNRFLDAVMGEKGMTPRQAGDALAKGTGQRRDVDRFASMAAARQRKTFKRAMQEGQNTVAHAINQDIKRGLSTARSYQQQVQQELGKTQSRNPARGKAREANEIER